MTETTKEAQKRRLAEALRSNLRRRKAAARPAADDVRPVATDSSGHAARRDAEPPADDGDRE